MTAAKPEMPETPPFRLYAAAPRLAANLAFYLGMAMGCTSIALLGYTIASWMLGSAIDGLTSLAMIALAVGSKQLLLHGIFADDLGHLFATAKDLPLDDIETATADTQQPHDEEAGTLRRIAA
jgi:hypothetical protein